MLNVGSAEKPSYMPAEVCKILEGQRSISALTPDQTSLMINFAAQQPHMNATALVQGSPSVIGVGNSQNPWMTGFKINIPSELIAVPARVLPAPDVLYGQKKTRQVTDGGWNMTGMQVSQPGNLKSWKPVFVRFSANFPVNQEDGPKAVQQFVAGLRSLGMGVEAPLAAASMLRLPELYEENFDMSVKSIFERDRGSVKYYIIFLPFKSVLLYERIKYWADVVYGVQCTCINATNLLDKYGKFKEYNPGYWANVGLKINVKCGGRNQSMDPKKLPLIGDDKTMIVGIDVTHPSPNSSDNAPSVSAMVANVDGHLGQYPAILRIQAKRKDEMVADLDEMLQTRLKLWLTKGKHKEYPENILVFRDGVSEGQYHLVLQHELPLLRNACRKLYGKDRQNQGLPRFFVAICGKRHNTRFMPANIEHQDGKSNPKPGTIVDRGITEARNWEFYLQAHKCLQGSAISAHFFIVHDEVFSNKSVIAKIGKPQYSVADIVEEMCHHLAYLYPRATKVVSLCPPAKLADRVCERARAYLRDYYDPTGGSQTASNTTGGTNTLNNQGDLVRVHDNIKDTMFYV